MIDYNNLPNCPVQTCLNFISDKWKILIIRDLMESTKRFNELKKSLEEKGYTFFSFISLYRIRAVC